MAVLLFAAILALAACAPRHPLPRENYGIAVNNTNCDRQRLEDLAATGVGWVRFTLYWQNVEPRRDRHVWNAPDRDYCILEDLRTAKELGLNTFLTVEGTPQWISTCREAPTFRLCPPADYAEWREFLVEAEAALVDPAGASVVDVWGIGNEPNTTDFWRGTHEEYYRLVEEADRALSEDATIAAPGLAHCRGDGTYGCDRTPARYLAEFRDAMERREVGVDIYAVHSYAASAEDLEAYLAGLAEGLRDDDVMWLAEAGRSVDQTDAQQREHVETTFRLLEESDIDQWEKYIGYFQWIVGPQPDGGPGYRLQGRPAEIKVRELMGLAPVAPTDVRVRDYSDSGGCRVVVEWRDRSRDERRFEVWRAREGDEEYVLVGSAEVNGTTFGVGGLDCGVRYRFRVRACGEGGCSTFTDPVEVTPVTAF